MREQKQHGKITGNRRIACQGENNQQVSGPELPGQGFLWPRDGPAQENDRYSSARSGKQQKEEETQGQSRRPGKEGGQARGRHGAEHLRADLRSNSRQDKGHSRSAESGPWSGRDLPGGRPGPRRRSHLRSPGRNPGQAQEVRGFGGARRKGGRGEGAQAGRQERTA